MNFMQVFGSAIVFFLGSVSLAEGPIWEVSTPAKSGTALSPLTVKEAYLIADQFSVKGCVMATVNATVLIAPCSGPRNADEVSFASKEAIPNEIDYTFFSTVKHNCPSDMPLVEQDVSTPSFKLYCTGDKISGNKFSVGGQPATTLMLGAPGKGVTVTTPPESASFIALKTKLLETAWQHKVQTDNYKYRFLKDGTFTRQHFSDYGSRPEIGKWALYELADGKGVLNLTPLSSKNACYWLPCDEEIDLDYDSAADALIVSGPLFVGKQRLTRSP